MAAAWVSDARLDLCAPHSQRPALLSRRSAQGRADHLVAVAATKARGDQAALTCWGERHPGATHATCYSFAGSGWLSWWRSCQCLPACLASPLGRSQVAALSVSHSLAEEEGLRCLPVPAKAMQGISSHSPLSLLSQVNNCVLRLGLQLPCLSRGSMALAFLGQACEEPSLHRGAGVGCLAKASRIRATDS